MITLTNPLANSWACSVNINKHSRDSWAVDFVSSLVHSGSKVLIQKIQANPIKHEITFIEVKQQFTEQKIQFSLYIYLLARSDQSLFFSGTEAMRNVCVGVKLWLLPCYTCFPWVNVQPKPNKPWNTRKASRVRRKREMTAPLHERKCLIVTWKIHEDELKQMNWEQITKYRKTAFIHPRVLIKSQGQHVSVLMCFQHEFGRKTPEWKCYMPRSQFNKILQDVRNISIAFKDKETSVKA